MPTITDSEIDQLLAAVLRGDKPAWPSGWSAGQALDRILYHGIAGLVADHAKSLPGWPAAVLLPVREQGVALAMWELRHQALLRSLLGAFAAAGINALLLKGTALAYDLYPSPATRARGDSDLLVALNDLAAARIIFASLGYRCSSLDEGIADDLALQEVWTIDCNAGTVHHIDLHWQLINAPALRGLLDYSDCAVDSLPLPRLCADGRTMSRPLTLLHTCVHRAMHLTSPYFVDGVTYYGGDRLIWAMDIDLLSTAMTREQWLRFTEAAIDQGVAAVCHDGLGFARRTLGTAVPPDVMTLLGERRGERASAYLLGSGQARRAWADIRGISGWQRKLAYVVARGLPTAAFLRGKYPALAEKPLVLLHARRMFELLRRRPGRGTRE